MRGNAPWGDTTLTSDDRAEQGNKGSKRYRDGDPVRGRTHCLLCATTYRVAIILPFTEGYVATLLTARLKIVLRCWRICSFSLSTQLALLVLGLLASI